MRIHIAAFLILISCLNTFSEAKAQKVTLQLKQVELETVFRAIEKQTAYSFAYGVSLLADSKPVTVQLKNASLTEALDQIFADLPYKYEIVNKTILIKAKIQANKQPTPEKVKPIRITGKVTDKNNIPLPAVSIRVRGTNVGTVTDANGNYAIDAEPDAVLVFTSVGFHTEQIKVNAQSEINLTLTELEAQLNETEIKGYYTTTKELNTGNVRSIKAADIAKQPVSDPLGTLQGRIPGLLVQQTSGAPGRAFDVIIRGQNSIANGNEPLYIIDGVQFNSTRLNSDNLQGSAAHTSPLNSISPADIESITVLKDADATAIYGSRGANGVILISTKKGQAGGTNFSLNTYHGVGKVAQRLNMMNTEEYLAMRREALANDSKQQPAATDYDLNGTYDLNKYTDWQEVMFGGRAAVNEIQGALSGGNERTQFRAGLGYRKEGNVFPGTNFMNKINSLISINHRSTNDRFVISMSANFVTGLNKMPPFDMTRYLSLAPNSPDIYDSSGKLNWQNNSWTNPFSEIAKKYTERTNNIGASSKVSYKLLPGLKLEANIGYNKNSLAQKNITPFSALNPTSTNPPSRRTITWTNNEVISWVFEPQITYAASLWKGSLDILIGSTFQETNQEFISQSASGFADDEQIESIIAGTTKSVSAYIPSQYRYNAVYGRIGYNIENRYVLNLTARRDGSSRFGPGKQFGNFGAIGVAWIFSNESWLKGNSMLNFGKLRASYGVTGNDKIGDYNYLSSYSYISTNYQGYSGLNPTQLTNTEYGWEAVNKFEVGIESSFFENRISLDISYYRNRTGNQLVGYPLPAMAGFASVTANLPAVVQNTGIEFEVGADILRKSGIKWTSNFNISIPRNKLVSYPGIESSSFSTRYAVGLPLSVSYLYKFTGINPETGLFTFNDKNKDGQITSAFDRSFIENNQKFYGGWNNSIFYKSFQLDVFFSFIKQTGRNYLFEGLPGSFFSSGLSNQPKEVANRQLYQPYSTGTINGPLIANLSLFNSSTGNYGDASFIRLKNVMFSWNLPLGKTINKVIKAGKLFVTGQNLFTITSYKGLDPEIGSVLRTPPLRTLAIGVNINL